MAVAAAVLLLAAPGCGGAEAPSTVAGCTTAVVRAITSGDLVETEAEEYPECTGLSREELEEAGEAAFEDPSVKAYIADLVTRGIDSVGGDGAAVTPAPVSPDPVRRGAG